jgi:hypothetical protein
MNVTGDTLKGLHMSDEPQKKDERELCMRFERHLNRLQQAGRCEWRPQVRMLHWPHGKDDTRRTIHIDYVARLDGGQLIGFEAKVAPAKAADLGRYLKQSHDYANSIIGGHANIPQGWAGKCLKAVFLVIEIDGCRDWIGEHFRAATRLMAAFRVGFVRRRHDGLQLYLCDEENWWCEAWGYRADAETRNSNARIGSQSFKLTAADTTPGAL